MGAEGTTTRAALIVNSGSRRGREEAGQARKLLKAAGVTLEAFYGVRNPARLQGTVRAALARGCKLIILGGGDGTVSAVVSELAGPGVLLGLLPMGTANDFARSLGVPDDLEAACATIARGKVLAVDLGLAGERHYVNVVTMGLGAEVVKNSSARLKRLLGPLAYPVATVLALRRYRPFAATLSFPDHDHPTQSYDRLLQIAVGNGRFYGGGAVVAPTARIDDGMLDVYAIELHSWWALVGVAWSLKSGRQVGRDDVPYWRTRRVQISTRPPMAVNMDGELVDQTPELFSVARGVLRVLVPAEETGAPGAANADSE
jgi:YegS/Rv2252/BmrU family lipid kinase